MYFSFIYTLDLIIWLLEMFVYQIWYIVYPLVYQIWKQRQYLVKGSASSKYRVEHESKKSNVNDILNILSTKRNTSILKCFLQFASTNLDGCQKEGGNFLNLLHKEGGSLRKKKGGGGGGLKGNCVETYTNTNFKFFKKNEFYWNTFCPCLEF